MFKTSQNLTRSTNSPVHIATRKIQSFAYTNSRGLVVGNFLLKSFCFNQGKCYVKDYILHNK